MKKFTRLQDAIPVLTAMNELGGAMYQLSPVLTPYNECSIRQAMSEEFNALEVNLRELAVKAGYNIPFASFQELHPQWGKCSCGTHLIEQAILKGDAEHAEPIK